ncbi:MAG: hypothetical protein JKY65_21035, partial [Planctomycetes bacterium]|nr:hypothetical protein [Planctomycetota bacterium]
ADTKAGSRLLERGVAKKHPKSTYLLGDLLIRGLPGVPANPARGKTLIRQAAKLGYKPAAAHLKARAW